MTVIPRGASVPALRPLLAVAVTWLLTAFAVVLYALGWLVGVVVQAAVWAWSGLVVGWRDGRDSIRKGWTA